MLTALHTTSSRPLSSSILFRRIPRSPVLLRRCASLVDWVRNASPAKHGWCSRSSLRLTRRTLCFGWGVRLRGVSPFVPSVIVVVLALALALVVALARVVKCLGTRRYWVKQRVLHRHRWDIRPFYVVLHSYTYFVGHQLRTFSVFVRQIMIKRKRCASHTG